MPRVYAWEGSLEPSEALRVTSVTKGAPGKYFVIVNGTTYALEMSSRAIIEGNNFTLIGGIRRYAEKSDDF